MELVAKFGRDDLAILYVARKKEKYLEFVESLQPPIPREDKWVIIISTMYGCPVRCEMCDAGTYYKGKISYQTMLDQIEHIVSRRFPSRTIPAKKFKVQFARMGEPALNNDVLDVMKLINKKLEHARETVVKINELKNEEDTELALWQSELDEMEKKLSLMNHTLMEPNL